MNAKLEIPKFVGGKKGVWKGSNILDKRYWIFGVLGKRRSGKSTLVYNLIKKFVEKHFIVLFFSHTFWKDENYKEIREFLDLKGVAWKHYDDIESGVEDFMREAGEKEEEDGEEIEKEKEEKIGAGDINRIVREYILGGGEEEEGTHGVKPRKKRKEKKVEYIVVFDDVSDKLRDTGVRKLIKNSFHYRSKIVLATQGYTDLAPDIYQNLDYVALYKNFNEYALKHIYDKIEMNIDFEDFMELYHKITDGSFNFLFIDRNNEEFRRNLDTKLKI